MKVFVTGSTGLIGTAVVRELLAHGHQVLGLARSDAAAEALKKMGAEAHRGSLEDLESLRSGAAASEGVIHLAFIHALGHMSLSKRLAMFAGAFSRGIMTSFGETTVGLDLKAIEVIGAALADTNRPFVTVLGTLSLTPGKLGKEQDGIDSGSFGSIRGNSEKAMMALAQKGVRASVIRFPPTVHGDGDKAFIAMMIKAAKKKGVSVFIGDGMNRWPAVHKLDAARLLRLALEKGEAGARYHGVADEGVPIKEIAETISRRLGVPVASKSNKEAAKHFGWLASILAIDNPSSSEWTQKQLGWAPTQPGLIADLEKGRYFESAA